MSKAPISGTALRQIRVQSGTRIAELAAQLGKDPSYLSHIEGGRKPVTAEVEEAYARLNTKDGTAKPEADLTRTVLEIIAAARPYHKGRWSSLFERVGAKMQGNPRAAKSLKGRRSPDDLVDLFSGVAKQTGSKTGDTVFLWNNLHSYDRTPIQVHYNSIVQNCIDNDLSFRHLIASQKNSDSSGEEALWLLRNYLRYMEHSRRVVFDTVQSFNFGMFEIDFLVVASKVADIRLSSGDFGQQKNGIVINSERQIEPLLAYLKRIESHRDYRLSMFVGARDLQRFFDAYSAADHTTGDRLIFQSFLGSYSTPPDTYTSGTRWWKHYTALNFDVDRLAESRKRSTSALKARLAVSEVSQLCSIEALTNWAVTGIRPDIIGSRVEETPAERRARIDYVVYLLKNFDRFSVGLISQNVGQQYGWSPFEPGRSSASWIVQGDKTLIFESSKLIQEDSVVGQIGDRDNRPNLRETEFQFILEDYPVTSSFRESFDRIWRDIPSQRRSKRDSINFFQDLRERVCQ